VLWPLIPEMLRIQSPSLLEAANARLGREIEERKQAEAALRIAHDELERRVAERTAALAHTEERVRLAVEAADVGFWDFDLETGYIEMSPLIDVVLGWNAAKSHTGEEVFTLIHPEVRWTPDMRQVAMRESCFYKRSRNRSSHEAVTAEAQRAV
jgi:PAS domain-containing protein